MTYIHTIHEHPPPIYPLPEAPLETLNRLRKERGLQPISETDFENYYGYLNEIV